uniref:Uncharacterized protein n=1 Tax=Avena sativa TaxID=4498 RepID=A0ACD5T8G2_AVESA
MASSPSLSSGLPHGVSFSPGDADLITLYLKRKISGSPLPTPTARYIHDADIYAAEPAALVAGLLAASPKNDGETKEWYFFTSVRAKSSRDTRRCRAVAGGGTWHSEKARIQVLDGDDEVVGYRQFFTFEPRNGWLMLEFSVVDREDGGGHRGEAIPVLCKIYQTRRQPVSKSGSKRKGERSGEGCSARVRRCLKFVTPPAAPDQVAPFVPSVTAEQESEDPKEPDKQLFFVPIEQEAEDPKEPPKQPFFSPIEQEAEDPKEPDKQPFFVQFEQEAEETQYSEFAGCLNPRFSMTLARSCEGLQFGSPPAAPNQLAMVAATPGCEDGLLVPVEPREEQEAEDPKEPDKQQADPWVTTTTPKFLVPFEQEADESRNSEYAGTSVIPTFPMTSYGTTPLHPGQDWATSEIQQGTDASSLLGNTAELSCYDGTTTSFPSYNTDIWSFPPSTLSSSGNTLLYPRHDTSLMEKVTYVRGCYDASPMYSWCGDTYAQTAPMSTRAEWANQGSNINPLSYLCI